MKSSSEFRQVSAATEALAQYIESGRNLEVIESKTILDHDIWQSVFSREKESEAVRAIQIKGLRKWLLEMDGKENLLKKMGATLFIIHLTNIVEWKTPLNLEDAIEIIIDGAGQDFLPFLIEESEISVNRRKEIVKPYYEPDDEWVHQSETVLNALNKYKK